MNKIFRRFGIELKNLVGVMAVMLGFTLVGVEGVNATKVATTNSVIYVDVPVGNMRQTSLEGTSWQLVSWGDPKRPNSVVRGTQITLEFRDNKVSGSASCNRYQASYETQENRLKINTTATTRMACPEEIMQQEMNYINALQATQSFEMESQNQLKIFYNSEQGEGVLVFKRSNL